MNKGFVILAQNTDKVNYVRCAEALAYSLKKFMPAMNVSLISDNQTNCPAFDSVIKLPYGDLDIDGEWKLINDWQVYEASPYDHTIKLEADMFIPKNIEHWFDILSVNDVVVCNKIRNFRNKISDVRVYRRFIDDNELPDVYNAITYFKKSEIAKTFFSTVRNIFENWDEYKTLLKCNPNEEATTDWVYSIACHIIGVEKTTLPNFDELSMIHMKQFIAGTFTEDWTDTLVYECLSDKLRVQTYTQEYPFHYIKKEFANKIIEKYKWKTTL